MLLGKLPNYAPSLLLIPGSRDGSEQGAETGRVLDLLTQREQREKWHAQRGLEPFPLGVGRGEEFTLEKVQLILDQ